MNWVEVVKTTMFANWLIGCSESYVCHICQGVRLAVTGMRKSYLKVVAAGCIILFSHFRETNKGIANEEMCYVLG